MPSGRVFDLTERRSFGFQSSPGLLATVPEDTLIVFLARFIDPMAAVRHGHDSHGTTGLPSMEQIFMVRVAIREVHRRVATLFA